MQYSEADLSARLVGRKESEDGRRWGIKISSRPRETQCTLHGDKCSTPTGTGSGSEDSRASEEAMTVPTLPPTVKGALIKVCLARGAVSST